MGKLKNIAYLRIFYRIHPDLEIVSICEESLLKSNLFTSEKSL